MSHAWRIALMTIRLVMRTKVALFFTFLFPVVFLFIYAGLFAHGNPEAVVYMFGPVVTLNIMGSGFWGLGMQSVVQRERGSLRRYRLAPLGAGTMVLSNLLANYLLELPTIALLVFCATVFFHMPLKIGFIALITLVTVGTFAFAGFGLTIASVANTMQEAQIYNNVVWLSLLFLSGVTVPLPLLPQWVQRLAAFLPATYLVSTFQAIMVQGQPLADHGPELIVLVVSGIFGLLFAWKLFRWEKEEKISRRAKWSAVVFALPFLITGGWMNAHGNLTSSWATSYNLMSRGSPAPSERNQARDANLIEDFESPSAAEDCLKRWQTTTDTSSGGRSIAELSLITAGGPGAGQALRFKGHLTPGPAAGDGFAAAQFGVNVPPQSRNIHGIELSVRGDGRLYQISFYPAAMISGRAGPRATNSIPAASRQAASAGSIQPSSNFVPLPEWQKVRLLVGWLANPPTGISTPDSWILEIRALGPAGDFQLDIDEIKFY